MHKVQVPHNSATVSLSFKSWPRLLPSFVADFRGWSQYNDCQEHDVSEQFHTAGSSVSFSLSRQQDINQSPRLSEVVESDDNALLLSRIPKASTVDQLVLTVNKTTLI